MLSEEHQAALAEAKTFAARNPGNWTALHCVQGPHSQRMHIHFQIGKLHGWSQPRECICALVIAVQRFPPAPRCDTPLPHDTFQQECTAGVAELLLGKMSQEAIASMPFLVKRCNCMQIGSPPNGLRPADKVQRSFVCSSVV